MPDACEFDAAAEMMAERRRLALDLIVSVFVRASYWLRTGNVCQRDLGRHREHGHVLRSYLSPECLHCGKGRDGDGEGHALLEVAVAEVPG